MIDVLEKKVNLVIGKRGSGKSYLTKKLIQGYSRLFIYDTQGEYDCGVVFEAEEYQELLTFWKDYCDTKFRLVYRPSNVLDLDVFDRVCELVYALGDMCFVCEEVHIYCNGNNITPHFIDILSRGRHKRIEVIGITQRPYNISRMLTSQAKRAYVFSTNEPRDIQYLKDSFGYSVAEMTGRLGEYEHVIWGDKGEHGISKA